MRVAVLYRFSLESGTGGLVASEQRLLVMTVERATFGFNLFCL